MHAAEVIAAEIAQECAPVGSGRWRYLTLIHQNPADISRLIGSLGVCLHDAGGTAKIEQVFANTDLSTSAPRLVTLHKIIDLMVDLKLDAEAAMIIIDAAGGTREELLAIIRTFHPEVIRES